MMFLIRLGVPEMEALWADLSEKAKRGLLGKDEESSIRRWGRLWCFSRMIRSIPDFIAMK